MPCQCDFEFYEPPKNVHKNNCDNKTIEKLKK